MKYGRGYKKFSAKLTAFAAVLIAFFVYANLKADIREYDGKVSILPDHDLLPVLVHDIANANQSIYMAMYMFKTSDNSITDTEMIKEALIKARKNGADVYVVMDNAEKNDITGPINKDTGDELKKAGITVVYDSKKVRLHAKTVVIDNKIVFIGSHNYTVSAMNKNREITARIVSPEAAKDTIDFIKSIK